MPKFPLTFYPIDDEKILAFVDGNEPKLSSARPSNGIAMSHHQKVTVETTQGKRQAVGKKDKPYVFECTSCAGRFVMEYVAYFQFASGYQQVGDDQFLWFLVGDENSYADSNYDYIGTWQCPACETENRFESLNPVGSTIRYPGSSKCYIATAAFGDQECDEVVALRAFRDEVLNNYRLGRVVVRLYECGAPYLVDRYGRNERLKKLARLLLRRFVRCIVRYRRRT